MSSFLGTYNISLDEKGRFNVPAKFRGTLDQSGPQLVVCAMEPFLVVFPQKEWAENEEKLSTLNAFNKEDRTRLREFYSRATDCEMKSGKILLPLNLRDIAGLKKEAVLVGMSKTFEIWSPERWGGQRGD
ncbi:division/cell wall cluster transcriptional repressor MraZ [Nitrospinaceae bacterium]|jgi:MraZ protein|nr:division/cell wall cluster transcriptional repressor MraZ [Nitrospinales bacterium]MDC1153631.1 division/cell wall cluster transcriptional repressor MraZ [Nitrospinaceae bacterium]MDG1929430.1 division/cell wall cluster transcriptional repressor MraZ [Nitrospinaceae bacterium]|tara:strand:- start:82 stop:471 length:390 start_codon:yes stop_codon:yes gene_type:complete